MEKKGSTRPAESRWRVEEATKEAEALRNELRGKWNRSALRGLPADISLSSFVEVQATLEGVRRELGEAERALALASTMKQGE